MRDDHITEHFTWREFACHNGTPVPPEYQAYARDLAEQLEVIREAVGFPLEVISAYRTPMYNRSIKGAKRSQHMLCKAADIRCAAVPPSVIYAKIEQLHVAGKIMQGGLGIYDKFVHYDIRGVHKRWDKRTKK